MISRPIAQLPYALIAAMLLLAACAPAPPAGPTAGAVPPAG